MKRKSRSILTAGLFIFTVLASVVFVLNLSYLDESPLRFTRHWDTPSAVSVAPDGSMAVIEKSKMQVSITDENGLLSSRIQGGSLDLDAFYYAEHVTTDGQTVVISEVRHAENSTFVQRERILVYDMNGNRLRTLYSVDYPQGERPIQLGRIRSVCLTDGQVWFTWVDGAQAGVTRCEAEGTTEIDHRTIFKDEFLRTSYEPKTQMLSFTTKKGKVGTAKTGETILWDAYGDGTEVPWSIVTTSGGILYISDLLDASIVGLHNDVKKLWQDGLVYELSAAQESIAFTDGETIYTMDATGALGITSRSVTLSLGYIARLLSAWVCAVYLLCVLCWLSYRLLGILRAQFLSEARQRMLIAAVSVLITVTIVMAFLLSFTQREMQQQTMNNLSQLATSICTNSSKVIGDRFQTITTLGDYKDEDYQAVRQYMDAFCDASYQNDANLYYILYQFDADQLWGVMDYENTTGARYPIGPLNDTLHGYVVATGQTMRVEGEANIYGMWSYAVAPVYTSAGTMVGLVEIGTNQYGEVVARHALIRNVIVGVLVALMMAMLAFNELMAYHDFRTRRALLLAEQSPRITMAFVRPLIFLVFMADNMDAAYIPQLSAQLGLTSAGFIGAGLASALPMSVQLLAIGLSALFSGRALDQRHPRKVLFIGFVWQMLGALLAIGAILFEQYWLLIAAKVVGGLGTGAAVVTCNALPAREPDVGEQKTLIAGLNIGVITGVVLGSAVGGYIAEYLGYWAAYIGSILSVVLAALLAWRALRGVEHIAIEGSHASPGTERGSAWRFLRQPRVFSFLLFVMIPFMLMMYFKDYLFPLFASGLGKTESVIGSVMLLGGMLAIFLGDVLPATMLSHMHAWRAVRLSSLLCAYALGLFALKPTYETAIVTICLLGVAASFGYAAQGVYYTELVSVGNIGDGKAMGMYSLFDNLGQTSGPLGLSTLLFMGVAMESGVIALGAVGFVLVATLVAKVSGVGVHSDG